MVWLGRPTRLLRIAQCFQRRGLHQVPQLTHGDAFAQNGVGRVFSPNAYNVAWHEYQGHLVQRLNDLTAGQPSSTKLTKDILQETARRPNQAALFNYASMAWNNHQFFTTLSPSPSPMSSLLQDRLSRSFSSIDSFREQFLATANGMFGPGFVWLIRNPSARAKTPGYDPEFSILVTYLAGSPLPAAHPRAQSVDLNTENELSMRAGAMGRFSASSDNTIAPGRMVRAEVCLGVCTWQHCYLPDFGVAGKKAYLERWWESVDWDVVERNAILDNDGQGFSPTRFSGIAKKRFGIR